MPGINGMGPLGDGPMTGRGIRTCNPNAREAPYGRGCGMRFGRGRRGSCSFNANSLAQPEQDELTILKQQSEIINNRISKLEEKE
jgi:hypothetical protein